MKLTVRETNPARRHQNKIGCVSLIAAVAVTTAILSIAAGELEQPLGAKGEGLILVLFTWVVIRFTLGAKWKQSEPPAGVAAGDTDSEQPR